MSEVQTTNNRPLIIAVIVILVLVLCCCLVVAGLIVAGIVTLPWSGIVDTGSARVEATEEIEQTFDVSAPMALEVDVNVGDVVIRAGADDEVRIYGVKRAWGANRQRAEEYLDDFDVQFRQTAGKVEVKAEMPSRLRRVGRTPSVELEIAVPRDARLDVVTNVGEVEVIGVQGAFDIVSNVGDVTLRDVRFEGNSRVRSDVGNIELRLPADVAFTFSAKTNVGNVRVDFDVQNERSDDKVVGESVEGEIGTSPKVRVELRTKTGDIAIRKAP
jgi:DUF4097 and DUF4098 domain-containing protein YvlB